MKTIFSQAQSIRVQYAACLQMDLLINKGQSIVWKEKKSKVVIADAAANGVEEHNATTAKKSPLLKLI